MPEKGYTVGYSAQQKQIAETIAEGKTEIKHLPERVVLYGNNQEEAQAYHLKLQELVSQVTESRHSIRRNYGFLLDETGLAENKFLKKERKKESKTFLSLNLS